MFVNYLSTTLHERVCLLWHIFFRVSAWSMRIELLLRMQLGEMHVESSTFVRTCAFLFFRACDHQYVRRRNDT